jgi:predicted Zn-dependent protease
MGALVIGLGLAIVFALPHIRAELRYHAAKKAFDERKLDRAADLVGECLQAWPDSARSHFLAAQVARRAGQYDRATEHLSRCEELGWPAEFVGLERSMMQAQQGAMSSALEDRLRSCIDKDIETDLVLEALADGYLRQMRPQDALSCLDKLLERQPRNAWALLARGRIYEGLNRPENADMDYRRLLEIEPDHDEGRLRLAQVLLGIGKPTEARQRLESLWESRPGDLTIGLALAKSLDQLGKLDKEAQLLNELTAQHPTALPALIAKGRLARQRGRAAEAETCFRAAVAQAPHDYDANYSLWQTLEARGNQAEARKYEAATRRIEQVIVELKAAMEEFKKKPEDPDLRCRIGVLYLRMGQDRAGLDWLNAVLAFKPLHSDAHRALAAWYTEHNESDKAAHHRQMAERGALKTGVP